MNIESVQGTSTAQRPTLPDPVRQPPRQEKASTAQNASLNSAVQEVRHDEEASQLQYSVQDAVKHLESFVSLTRADINFTIDESSGVQVVKVVDRQSKEIIRQFPSEEAIRIAQALDQLQGVFLKDKA